MNISEIIITWFLICVLFVLTNQNIDEKHLETQAIILEYQSKLTAVEVEKQKTITGFLRSVKTGRENRDVKELP